MNRMLPVAGAIALVLASQGASAAATNFSNFTAIPSSVAVNSLSGTAPFVFGSANFSQLSITDRTTQLGLGQFNTGSWDRIDTNRTGANAGCYLFTVYETGQSGVRRTDLAAYKGTNYQRPEDPEIRTLANGDQILYVATTTSHAVYFLNLATGQRRKRPTPPA